MQNGGVAARSTTFGHFEVCLHLLGGTLGGAGVHEIADVFEDGDDFRSAGGEEKCANLVYRKMFGNHGVGKQLRCFLLGGAVACNFFASLFRALLGGKVDAADGFEPKQGDALELGRFLTVAHDGHEFGDRFEFNRPTAFNVDDGVAVAGGFTGETFVGQAFDFPEVAE